MLDSYARRALAPPLQVIADGLSRLGVAPTSLTVMGLLVGIGACGAVAAELWWLALVLWLLNRLLDGLDGPLARRRGPTEFGGFLDIVADFTVYTGFVVALAIALPEARLACTVLLMAYCLSSTAFLALSSLLERADRGGGSATTRKSSDGRSLRFIGGLAEGTETVIVYALICLLPHYAVTLLWIFAAAVALTVLQRVFLGYRLLGGT